jgi:tartrate/fumarate subfamily iron-sulfur-dependent hydro-lyase beta chain
VILKTPLQEEDVRNLHIGDVVFLQGLVYTARDMAHQRLSSYLEEGREIPERLAGGVIFHAGPVARLEGGVWQLLGIGPTTSIRMEPFSHLVPQLGVRALVGKGGMKDESLRIFKEYGCVYLLAAPGCSVKHSSCVQSVKGVHWLDLGMPEAMWVLEVQEWGPLVVGMDSHGRSIFKDIEERGRKILQELY